jgi:neutral amino acid transport system permease protein
VKSATAEDRTFLAKAMKVFLIAVLALGGVLFAAPAMADSVGEDFENQVSGNVRNEGTPLSGVRIMIEGNGYSAETVTDGDGKWSIGVPEAGTYEITLVEDTLPDGIAVLEGGATQTIEWGFTNSVVWNFFIGEAERNPTSQLDQFFMRVFAGVNFGLLLGLAAIGLSLVFGTTALPNFAHGEMVTMGALFTLFLTLAGVPLLLSFPIAVALSALFGWGLDAAIWAPLRARGVGIVQLMIVSIGLSLTFRYITQAFLGGGTEQLPGALGSPEIPIFRTVTLSVNDLVSMGVSLVVLDCLRLLVAS